MKFMLNLKCVVTILAGAAILAWANLAEAQAVPENTAAACQDRIDNDGDGYVDCRDQDCGAIVTCAGGARVVPVPLMFQPRPADPTPG